MYIIIFIDNYSGSQQRRKTVVSQRSGQAESHPTHCIFMAFMHSNGSVLLMYPQWAGWNVLPI